MQSLFLSEMHSKHEDIKNRPRLHQLFFWKCKQKSKTSICTQDLDFFVAYIDLNVVQVNIKMTFSRKHDIEVHGQNVTYYTGVILGGNLRE